jgi:hypothetical protein
MLIQFKDRTGNWKYEMPFDVNQRDLSGQSILYLACCIGNLRFAFHFFEASGSDGCKPFASGSNSCKPFASGSNGFKPFASGSSGCKPLCFCR